MTDLHSCCYGEAQGELLAALEAEKPDILLPGGDIFDDELPDIGAERFLFGLARESTRIFRYYNRPEVLMVDLVPEEAPGR